MLQHGCILKIFMLKKIVLSEISHRSTNTVQFYLYELPRVVKFIETKSRIGGKQNAEQFDGYSGSSWEYKNFWKKKWVVVITAQQGKCTNATEMYT